MSQNQHTNTVLVTAGASGIGFAIAEAFLANGDQVHICDINEKAIEQALSKHSELQASVADVGDPLAVDKLFADIEGRWGGLSVLVNNAGVGGQRASLDELDDDAWDACIRVNLSGAFYCMKRAIKWMKRDRHGAIINISTASVRTGLPFRAPYVASKAGLEALTTNAARELGPHNIRCNAILPGAINNERGQNLIRIQAETQGISYTEAQAEALKYTSMRTMIEMSEIGDMAVFLASDRAKHVSGQKIGVCGNAEWEE
ncbi:MAG: SDR family oxidoreductase [Kordiimonadaceae bacterium]|nr:SDR family oxidoreductase [Kordiimonadaceae bacterium]